VEAVDEFEHGFGWIQDELMQRCSHALVVDGRVWVIDPVADDLVEERIHAAGTPAGVIQLLDRHRRDCVTFANRLGVPHHVVPETPIGPFEFLPVRRRNAWKEVALWWPDKRLLVCADALGTAAYFRAGGERLAVHPLLRLRPPDLPFEPDAILCGHGTGVFTETTAALREALATSRRRLPLQLASAVAAYGRRWTRGKSGV
jgi:hypothetical protein